MQEERQVLECDELQFNYHVTRISRKSRDPLLISNFANTYCRIGHCLMSKAALKARAQVVVRFLVISLTSFTQTSAIASPHSRWESCSYPTSWTSSRCPWRQVNGFLQRIQCEDFPCRTGSAYPHSHYCATRSFIHIHHQDTTCLIFFEESGWDRKRDWKTRARDYWNNQPQTRV